MNLQIKKKKTVIKQISKQNEYINKETKKHVSKPTSKQRKKYY